MLCAVDLIAGNDFLLHACGPLVCSASRIASLPMNGGILSLRQQSCLISATITVTLVPRLAFFSSCYEKIASSVCG
jgi:hypothetical protein